MGGVVNSSDLTVVPVKRIRGRSIVIENAVVKRCSAWSKEGDRCELAKGHSGNHEPWQGSGYAFGGTEYECPPPTVKSMALELTPNGGTTTEIPNGSTHDCTTDHGGVLHHMKWVAVGILAQTWAFPLEHLIWERTPLLSDITRWLGL